MKNNRFHSILRALPVLLGAAALFSFIAVAVSPDHADVTVGIFASLGLLVAITGDYASPRRQIHTLFRAEIPSPAVAAYKNRRVIRVKVPALTERR